MLTVAICLEDEAICTELERLIRQCEETSLVRISTGIFNNGEKLIQYIKMQHGFDLIFLDMDLKNTEGLELARRIREELEDNISKIALITSDDVFSEPFFEIQPFNLLRKPINEEKLKKCISLAIKTINAENKSFSYKKRHEIIKVNIDDIIFFESRGQNADYRAYEKRASIQMMMDDVNKYPNLDGISDSTWRAFCEKFNHYVTLTPTPPNKEVHYFRNKLNRAPGTLDEMVLINEFILPEGKKWELMPVDKSIYHMYLTNYCTQPESNLKFVSYDGEIQRLVDYCSLL